VARLILIALVGVCLTGCGGQETPPAPAKTAVPVSVDPPKPSEPIPGKRLTLAQPAAPALAASINSSNLPIYELQISAADLRALEDNPGSDRTYPGVFRAEGQAYEGVQVRYRGQWARSWPKKPFKIFFPRDKPFQGHHSLNLNSAWRDPALVRETLAYQIYAAAGVPASRSRMVQLRVNGKFHGLYVDVEQVDKPFLKRFQLQGATLFKAASPNNQSDERDFPTPRAFTRHYENETGRTNDLELLQRFCHELAAATNVLEFFTQHVDLERYVSYLAASALVQHWDGFNKNHFLVRDNRGPGQWFIVPWDLDRTLGDHWQHSFDAAELPLLLGVRSLPGPTGWNRLQERFFSEPALRERFFQRLQFLVEHEFTEEKLFPVLDQFATQLGPLASQDRRRWSGPDESLQAGMAELKQVIRQRRKFVRQELSQATRAVNPGR
jgi:spore coat protein H